MVYLDYGHRKSVIQRLKPYLHRWWFYAFMAAILVLALSPWLYHRVYLGNRTIHLYGRIVDVNGQALAGATVRLHVTQLVSYRFYDSRYLYLLPDERTGADYTVTTGSDGRFELHGIYGRYVYVSGVKASKKGYRVSQPYDKPPYTETSMDYGSLIMFLPTTRSREVTISAEEDQRFYFP